MQCKNWNHRNRLLPQSRGVKQGCSLSSTLLDIYIDEVVKSLEESEIPGLTLSDIEVECLLFADDLILLAPSKEALQKQLLHLQKFCQTWALTVNLVKTRVMMFQKRPKSQNNPHRFHLDSTDIEHTHSYTYLGIISHVQDISICPLMIFETRAERAFYELLDMYNPNPKHTPMLFVPKQTILHGRLSELCN